MASDLSSGCTEVNEIFDDEKEEGEISLEDVSSSEEGQLYKYNPRINGKCPYCLSMPHATWCRSLTVNKNNIKRDSGLQGKENRNKYRNYSKDSPLCISSQLSTGSTTIPTTKGINGIPYSTLQEKNDDDNDLVPISSDSDMELVGLDTKPEKKRHRARIRKKRRKKSTSPLSLSLSPSSVDLAIKESIHRVETTSPIAADFKKESSHKNHCRSPEKKKAPTSKALTPTRRHNRVPVTRIRASPHLKRKLKSPLRKTSPLRPCKLLTKKTVPVTSDSPVTPLLQQKRANFSKLLKKVKLLEPFRLKESGTSLKDKLSNIICKKGQITSKEKFNNKDVLCLTSSKEEVIVIPHEEVEEEKNKGKKEQEENIKEKKDKEENVKEKKDKEVKGKEKKDKDEKGKEKKDKEEKGKEKKDKEEKGKEKKGKVGKSKDKKGPEEKTKIEAQKKVSKKEEKKPVENQANIVDENNKDDEEDLVILRQIALETKHKKSVLLKPEEIKTEPVDQPLPPPLTPPISSTELEAQLDIEPEPETQVDSQKLPNFCMDDNDEDLELRMIALRSAVLKKHRTRMQCGKKKRKRPNSPLPRIESPFTNSFLEDFPFLAEICSPTSPLSFKKDIYSTEDMELDSDIELDKEIAALSEGESPYSPTDEISHQLETNIERKEVNMSLYSPSNPTDTPMGIGIPNDPASKNTMDGSFLEFTNQESRPYSPTDLTIYDPDLPGVHSTGSKTAPLQPPPLPPLSMFQQPMLLGCTPNLMGPYVDPSVQMVPTPMNNFTAMHQSINPLLMPTPAAAAPLFTYPTTPQTTSLGMNVSPVVSLGMNVSTATSMNMNISPSTNLGTNIPTVTNLGMNTQVSTNLNMNLSATASMNVSGSTNLSVNNPTPINEHHQQTISKIVNESLDSFGETDIDGSPLVPIEKDANHHSSWTILGEPLYLHNMHSINNMNGYHAPPFRQPHLVSNIQQIKPVKNIQSGQEHEGLFKNAEMTPVDLKSSKCINSTHFKPIKLNSPPKKSVTGQSAAVFSQEPEKEFTEEQLHVPSQSENSRAKRRSSTTSLQSSNKRKRKRRSSLRRSNSILSSNDEDKEMKNKNDAKKQSQSQSPLEKKRRGSVEDDEETLRQILLASLAKRVNNQKQPATVNSQVTEVPGMKVLDKSENSTLKADTTNSSQPKILNASVSQNPVASSIPIKKTTTVTNPLTTLSTRKIVRKANMIPASTKVVNNAKRYQNLLLQRKLQQQKISQITSSKSRFKINNNIGNNSTQGSPKLVKKKPEMERIIINLNEDTESESDAEEAKLKQSPPKPVRPVLNIPTTDFEKSLDHFLKDLKAKHDKSSKTNEVVSKSTVPPSISIKNLPPPSAPPVTKAVITAVPSGVISTVSTASSVGTSIVTTSVTSISNITATSVSTASIVGDTSNTGNSIATVTSDTTASTSITPKTATVNITAAVVAPKLTNEKIVNTKSTKTDFKLSSSIATQQVLKHLPIPQQEEYRRLKQQLLEREKQLQRVKESIATSILPQAQPANEKIIKSSSNSSMTPSSLALSTLISASKATAAIQSLSQSKDVLNKTLLKPNTDALKAPIVQTATKIVHSAPNATEDNTAISKTISSNLATKNNVNLSNSKPTIIATRTIAQPAVLPSKSNVPNANKQQTVLLSKMNDALNNQKMQITAVAQKVSNLRILTKEQINNKTSSVQQTISSKGSVCMDDLNKVMPKVDASQKTELNNVTVGKNCAGVDKPLSKNSQSKGESPYSEKVSINKSTQSWEDFKQFVNNEVESLTILSSDEQKKILSETEEELVKKRHSVLDDITEMSGSLRQWEIERDMQDLLSAEVKNLREQLKKAEKKLQQQKSKLNSIQPKVSSYHEKVNTGRKECFRLSKICNGLGQQVIGPTYRVPTAAAELLNNRIKEVATHTQKLRNKKTQSIESIKSNFTKTDKAKSKNNSKTNTNTNSILNQKESNFNKKISNSASESANIDSNVIRENVDISITESQSKSNNLNKKLIDTNVIQKEVEIQQINKDSETPSVRKTNVDNGILKSGNKSLTHNSKLNTILITKNNFNELSKTNSPDTILKIENILNETSNPPEKNIIIENEEPLSNSVLTSNNMFESEHEKQLSNLSNLNNINSFSGNSETSSLNYENSLVNVKNEDFRSSLNLNTENLTSSELNNIYIKSEQPSVGAMIENVIINEDIVIKLESDQSDLELNPANDTEFDNTASKSNEKLIEAEVENLNKESAVMPINPEESAATANTENNSYLNNSNKILVLNSELNIQKLSFKKNSTSEIFKSVEHSTVTKDTLSKVQSTVEKPKDITQRSRPTIRVKSFEQLSKHIEKTQSRTQDHLVTKKKAIQPYESILKHFNVPRYFMRSLPSPVLRIRKDVSLLQQL